MNDDFLFRYGRAVYEAAKWTREAELLLIEVQAKACSDAAIAGYSASAVAIQPQGPSGANSIQSESGDENLKAGGRYYGIFSCVAKKLSVSPVSVLRVWNKQITSARISEALAAEKEKRDNRSFKPRQPLSSISPEEHLLFQFGNRYYGVIAEVSKDLGIRRSVVSRVASNKKSSYRVLTSLREAMGRRDAALATKQEVSR
jgi:hypothetical protein